MHRPSRSGVFCLVLTLLAAAGCSDETGTPPIVPTPVEITEPPFTGTLTINGGVTQPFSVTASGTVTAILDTLEPNPDFTLSVGVLLGTWNGTSCQSVLTNDNTGVGSGVAGFANGAGNLCARIYDVGKLTEPVTFSITIKHF